MILYTLFEKSRHTALFLDDLRKCTLTNHTSVAKSMNSSGKQNTFVIVNFEIDYKYKSMAVIRNLLINLSFKLLLYEKVPFICNISKGFIKLHYTSHGYN